MKRLVTALVIGALIAAVGVTAWQGGSRDGVAQSECRTGGFWVVSNTDSDSIANANGGHCVQVSRDPADLAPTPTIEVDDRRFGQHALITPVPVASTGAGNVVIIPTPTRVSVDGFDTMRDGRLVTKNKPTDGCPDGYNDTLGMAVDGSNGKVKRWICYPQN